MTTLLAPAVPTKIYRPETDLRAFLHAHLSGEVKEKHVVAITSKILSIAEARFVAKDSIGKLDLIKRESDRFICETSHGVTLTIKEGLLIPSAGIDESNQKAESIPAYPGGSIRLGSADPRLVKRRLRTEGSRRDPHRLAHAAAPAGRDRHRARALGIPRDAESGGRAGPLRSHAQDDSCANVVDALAVSAVYVMGEAAECCPLALIESPGVVFQEPTHDPLEIRIPLEEDLWAAPH